MVKVLHSLSTKLIASFVVLILITSGLTFFYTYGETKNALKESTQSELMAVAGAVAVQVDGDAFASLKPGDESTQAFIRIRDDFKSVQQTNPDVLYVYSMRKSGNEIVFVVDADYGYDEDVAGIGEIYEGVTENMLDGFEGLSADDEFTTDQWGTVLSGYAPIRNSAGEVVGIVGIDMDSSDVIERQNFIGNTIYLIIGIASLVAAFIIGIFSLTIIRDIRKLNATARAISMGDLSVTVDVRRKDEIGELADSFSRMVASLKIFMDTDEETKRE
ncbi:histidine kinase HAMP region domain protein [Methanofollis liminatans DSM 4140]|uniref:histidine kinase n=1 Tax=Methanofollis liminatans DSM 4140 TaxID=28892 RepID=J1L099_9EURY|nr:HAMP domain-containing protein [Methanofollis liminatans]EJG06040.1 histidine kinase HAMP region domain protein [Methanofollis liminatans DSM 4140]